MKIPFEIAQRVVTGNMQELWDTFVNLDGEYEEYETDYEKVRYGTVVMFEIHDLWEDTKKIIRKDKEGKVLIENKTYKISDFRTEKEQRRKLMSQAILNNVEMKTTIKPRG